MKSENHSEWVVHSCQPGMGRGGGGELRRLPYLLGTFTEKEYAIGQSGRMYMKTAAGVDATVAIMDDG
ncbi:MAG: hypothetical protein AB9866_03725 [Syntrophobacteraceae bacterium]